MDTGKIKEQIIEQIQTIYDPEIPVDIWELGLIYDIDVKEDGSVILLMTLTSPACPVAESLPMEVQEKVIGLAGVTDVDLRLVWDPPWSKERMSDEAKLALDMF
ncbi:MAG: SUF system Fe-S cluster assembly protein [Saprospiraceae bacterium]|nr:SUF system Fe-S cluster assembly protein [Saprospiraceae bacterium]